MKTADFIHDLTDWIDKNLEERLDINTVAERAGYSKWYLQRMFKEHTGSALGEYIRAKKIKYFCRATGEQRRAHRQCGYLSGLRFPAVL